ncbi:MAG TPA: hypothetical protein VJ813_20150, partial [Vicinamibacterales bacterium]|nr:hypothetical protein [Vicinamibacterales bacterium]
MRSRAVRVTLTLLAVVAIAAAAYFYWTRQARITHIAEAAGAFDASRGSAARRAFELRLSQQAYVAAGQHEAFWFNRVSTEIHALRSALPALKA